jgi:hypothetical protein
VLLLDAFAVVGVLDTLFFAGVILNLAYGEPRPFWFMAGLASCTE